MNETIIEYICHYCPNPSVLTKRELKIIEDAYKRNDLIWIEFNKKGHLIFCQRYPNFPTYFSVFALSVNVIVLIYILIKLYLKISKIRA